MGARIGNFRVAGGVGRVVGGRINRGFEDVRVIVPVVGMTWEVLRVVDCPF